MHSVNARLLLAVSAAAWLAASVHAQTSAAASTDEAVQLPAFTVTETSNDPLNANEAVSVARTEGSLLDTPATARIITSDLVATIGADSVYDATRYFPGINNGRGAGDAGFLDREDFRGFESNTVTVDDFALTLLPTGNGPNGNFDPSMIDRVEVVLGPDSILSPTGTPGGSMNIMTKSPQYKPSNEATYTFGNYDGNKATFDSTGPVPGLDGRLAYRVVAAFQDAQTYIPGGIERKVIEIALSYKVSDTSNLTFKYVGTQEKFLGAAADPNDNGWEVTDPSSIGGAIIANTPSANSGFTYNGLNGDPAWAQYTNRYNIFMANYTAALGPHISMRVGAFVDYDRNDGYQAYPSTAPGEIYDPNTGQVIGLKSVPNPAALPVLSRFTPTYARIEEFQNDFAGNWDFSGVTFKPAAGVTYEQVYLASIPGGQINLPADDLFLPYNPPDTPIQDYPLGGGSKSEAWQDTAYAYARLGFLHDHLIASGGTAYIEANSNQYSLNANPALPASLLTLNGHKETYFAGLVYKLTDWASVYYSYSSNASLTSNNRQPLWQDGKQHEFGFKANFFHDRLSFTADHFQIAQTNIVTPNPLFNVDPVNNPVSLLNDVTNHGYEFGVTGGLTQDLSIIASYTYMKYRDQYGRRARNVPDKFGDVMLNYRPHDGPLKDFSVWAAVLSEGDVAGEAPPNAATSTGAVEQVGFYVAGYAVGNAGIKYHWDKYSIGLTLNNITDEKFVWEPASRFSVSPYPGFNWLVTLGVKF
ncbi:MAG TPA: TonB-dependent receptor plug domain-containing protein [Opitutaceae bacterium]|jgi:outer membrane receptor protein involved in Fe transport